MTEFPFVDNEAGYSVLRRQNLFCIVSDAVCEHISRQLGLTFGSLKSVVTFLSNDLSSHPFREKKKRILPRDLATRVGEAVWRELPFPSGSFVSDEEALGYANYYWRAVRPGFTEDVGPVHADRWFWDLGNGEISGAYRRVKCWMPLVMSDIACGLLTAPGSHRTQYQYSSQVAADGKRKPVFDARENGLELHDAPITIGELILFHDDLLHGGRSTDAYRLSFEFTVVISTDQLA
jgi:hypothetical protein